MYLKSGLIAIIAIVLLVSSCSGKKESGGDTAATGSTIYGVWRHIKTVDVEHGETFYPEDGRLISLYYVDENNMIYATPSGIQHGVLYDTGNNYFNFSYTASWISDDGEINEVTPPPYVFSIDPESGCLIEHDHTVQIYYEWVQDALADLKQLFPSQQLVYTVEFNNETIPMIVFYSREAGSEYYVTDSITFEYDGRKHSISLDDVAEKFAFADPADFHLIDCATDYNFDAYMDIAILSGRGVRHSWSDIFIYNPQTKSYYHHKELSQENDVWTDSETQTVRVHGIGGHAGLIYTSKDYKWINGQLTLVGIVNQDYDDTLELYICTTRTLQNNGTWSEKRETFTEEDLF